MASASALKEQGNAAFSKGNYKDATMLYTRAIQKDPQNPFLHTNRAFARIKLAAWEPCIDDCIRAIELQSDNMKAYYYLAQAQVALKHPNEALSSALRAYELCLASNSPSAGAIATLILDAKKQKWEARERERLRRRSGLLMELEDALTRAGNLKIAEMEDQIGMDKIDAGERKEEMLELRNELRKKVEELKSVFAISDPENLQRREVPDYMIDNITFAVMHDPVITKRGQSYERATIEMHLASSGTDPLTREPLTKADLRPNLALKAACEQFLEENGWAVDW